MPSFVVRCSARPAYRIADGPMSTPRRPWPRSSAAPITATEPGRAATRGRLDLRRVSVDPVFRSARTGVTTLAGTLGRGGSTSMLRLFAALALACALTVIPLGTAAASSSTGKRIAYISGNDLRTIAADGTGTTSFGEIANTPRTPSISSDGTVIVFDTGASLRSVTVGGPPGSSAPLCGLLGTHPAVSPDGTRVAFVSGSDVVVRAIDCSGGTTTIGAGTQPAWSPDGTQIAFVDAAADLAVAGAGGGTPEKLGSTSAHESEPAWSPDGSRLAYISGEELFVMNADGTGRNQLTSNAAVESSPTWAPGGD